MRLPIALSCVFCLSCPVALVPLTAILTDSVRGRTAPGKCHPLSFFWINLKYNWIKYKYQIERNVMKDGRHRSNVQIQARLDPVDVHFCALGLETQTTQYKIVGLLPVEQIQKIQLRIKYKILKKILNTKYQRN